MAENHPREIAKVVVSRRGSLFLLSIAAGIFLAFGIASTTFNTSLGELLSESDPYLDELEEMEQRFPRSLTVNFAFAADFKGENEGSVFNQLTLGALRDLDSRYMILPGATRLSSILSYSSPQKNFTLFDRPSADYSTKQLAELQVLALDDELLANTYLAPDAGLTFATVFVDIDQSSQRDRLQLAHAAIALTEELRSANPQGSIYVNSDVLFEQSTQDAMIQDITTLLPIVILICVLTICYCFASISFGACILSQALLSLICTIGVIGYTGIGFNTISIIAPLIVVIISVAHSVHIISVYKQQLFKGLPYVEAMSMSISYNLKPVLLATVTTAIGFLSLNLSSSPAIQDFGRIVALGIGFAFIYTFTLLPALLVWISARTRAHGKTMDAVLPNKLINKIKPFWQKREKPLFICFSVLSIVTLLLLPLNKTDFNRLDFIESDSEVGKYYDVVSAGLQRGPVLVYGISSGQVEGAIEPNFLHQVESFSIWLKEQAEIDNAGSLVEVVKTIHQGRNGQNRDYYSIPRDADAIAVDLDIYQSIEFADFPLHSFIDEDFSTIRLVINARPLSNQQLIDLDEKISTQFEQQFDAHDARLIHGSGIILFARMDGLITVELLQGYSLSLLLITLTLVIGFRSLYFGLLSVLPNLLPATIVFGAWGLFVGQLDPFVMMLFSVSIGLVVDDSVHILTHYLDNRKQGMQIDTAFNQSLDTAGPALVVTTAVLALGTTILIGASTLYFQQAAKLLVPIVLMALVLDLLYLPTILKRFDKGISLPD